MLGLGSGEGSRVGHNLISFFSRFGKLKPSVLAIILSEFCLQMTHNAFFLVANFYLSHHGYSDAKIADMLSARFLVVLLISLPLGLVLGRMRLLPLLRLAAWVTPLGYGLFLYAVPGHRDTLLYVANGLIGISMAIFQVIVVPYIIRNEESAKQSDAIALSFSNWSTTTFVLGLGFFLLNHWRESPIAESTLLISMLSF